MLSCVGESQPTLLKGRGRRFLLLSRTVNGELSSVNCRKSFRMRTYKQTPRFTGFWPKLPAVTPLECAVTKAASVNSLECALTKKVGVRAPMGTHFPFSLFHIRSTCAPDQSGQRCAHFHDSFICAREPRMPEYQDAKTNFF